MHIIFVYSSKRARTTLIKLLNIGGLNIVTKYNRISVRPTDQGHWDFLNVLNQSLTRLSGLFVTQN